MLDLFQTNWRDLWKDIPLDKSVGAVFTRPEIVARMLDLAGYVPGDKRLATTTVLEPSCGDGAFLSEVVERLIQSERISSAVPNWNDIILDDAIRAIDIDEATLIEARRIVVDKLHGAGCTPLRSAELAEKWIVAGDFLLSEWPHQFELVVGNPPYVRIEALPPRLLKHYRDLVTTATDRADLYIAFFEKGLSLLSDTGCLAFICANRFTKNQYGRNLRRLIASHYHVRYYINLEHTQPFVSNVSAYPAVFVIDRNRGTPTQATTLRNLDPETLALLSGSMTGERSNTLATFSEWYPDGEPWTSTSNHLHAAQLHLEQSFPLLEDSAPGTRVGIGVATGADAVFVLSGQRQDIEESRQVPMVMASDIGTESIEWSGHYIVNPFEDADNDGLVDLARYPLLAEYLNTHADRLKSRYVAKNRPRTWYRTIDRIWAGLQRTPKIVIPDIQSGGVIGIDRGEYYPHHNVYWITSTSWNLEALRTLLRSSIVQAQVEAYSIQMRGESLRYQAQTLRRIRVPRLVDISHDLLRKLEDAATSNNQTLIDALATEAYAHD
jgi:hypothetical protein